MLLTKSPSTGLVDRLSLPFAVLLLGMAAVLLPTMFDVARLTWTTDQGGHAPIIVATGLWLLWREFNNVRAQATVGKIGIGVAALVLSLTAFVVFRITGILELEALAMYASLVAVGYLLIGGTALRCLWFPILYLAVALPPPNTVVAFITQPIKILISQTAVSLLRMFDFPIASTGVTIQIDNYQLLVAAACAGLNSIISLSAICLFYVYLRHRRDWAAFFIVAALVVPVAIFSNFIRVLILVLITHYAGEAAAQGFLHDFAGLTVFLVALLTIFGLDSLITNLRYRRARN